MTSISDVKLIIVTIEKDIPSYSTHKITKDMRKCDDIYLKAIENKWIKSKQTFFFINKGELLFGDTDLSKINTDIVNPINIQVAPVKYPFFSFGFKIEFKCL